MSSLSRSPRLRELRLRPELASAQSDAPIAERCFARALRQAVEEQDFVAALASLKEARERFTGESERAECSLEEAHIHSLLGRVDDSLAVLGRVISELSERHELWFEANYQSAQLLASRGDYEAALIPLSRSRPHYEADSTLGLGDYYGFEAWVHEQRGDFAAWARSLRALLENDPDKLALHKLPPDTEATQRRCARLCQGLIELEARTQDPGERRWIFTVRAMTLFIGRDYKSARSLLEDLLLENDREAFVDHLAGKCLLRMDDAPRARDCLERAAQAGPIYFDLLLDLAMAQEACDDDVSAHATYQRLMAIAPQDIVPILRSAAVKERSSDWPAAAEAYQRAQECDPTNRTALVRLALLNAELGRDDDALKGLGRALQVVGNDPGLLIARARVQRRLGLDKPALRDASRALESLEPLLVSSTGAGSREVASAEDQLDASEGHAPPRRRRLTARTARRLASQAQIVLARINFESGRHEEADRLVRSVLDDKPDDEEALLLSGDIARVRGTTRDAVDSYKAFIDKILCKTLLDDGARLCERGEFNEALRKYRQACERFPKNWEVFYRAALAYAALDQLNLALQYLQIAARLNREVPALALDEPGFALLRRGNGFMQAVDSGDELSNSERLLLEP